MSTGHYTAATHKMTNTMGKTARSQWIECKVPHRCELSRHKALKELLSHSSQFHVLIRFGVEANKRELFVQLL